MDREDVLVQKVEVTAPSNMVEENFMSPFSEVVYF